MPPTPAPETYGYGTPPTPAPEAYGYGTPPTPAPEAYGYGVPPGQAPYGYGPPQYYPANPYQYAAPRQIEGLAIASLVLSCSAVIGICTWGVGGLLGVVGAILGHVARGRIKTNGNDGAGLALAGIIVGWILAAFGVALTVILVFVVTHDIGSVRRV